MPPPSRKITDLRRPAAIPVVAPKPAPPPPGRGPLLAVGQVGIVGPSGDLVPLAGAAGPATPLSPDEKAGLAALGLPTDAPPPPGLADFIAQVVAENREGGVHPAVPVGHRLAAPREVGLDALTDAHKKEILAFYQQAAAARDLDEQVRAAVVPGAGPGVNEAIAAAVRAPNGKVVGVVDDLTPAPAAAPVAAVVPVPPAPGSTLEPPAGEAGGFPVRTHCQHCGWDLRTDDVFEVTDADKLVFLAAMLGDRRFEKEVSLLGGRLKVGFRTLTATEAQLAFRQVQCDLAARESAAGEASELWGNLIAYRLVMGLAYLERPTGERQDIAPLDEMLCDAAAPGDTRLKPYYEAVTLKFLPTDSLRRVVGDAYHLFNHVVEKMEIRATDPDFWPAIDGQP